MNRENNFGNIGTLDFRNLEIISGQVVPIFPILFLRSERLGHVMEELIDLQSVQHKKEEAEECFELQPNATSLTLLQKVYRSSSVGLQTRIRAAMAALQFEHPKLAVNANVDSADFAVQLDRAVNASRKIIEAQPISVSSDIPSSDTKPTVQTSNGHKPSVPDRRYRRW